MLLGFMRSMTMCSKRSFQLLILAIALVLSLQACPTARAEVYELDLHLHAEPGDASDMFDAAGNPVSEAPPGGALLPVIAAAETTRPENTIWNFTGTTSGSALWVLPKSNTGIDVLYLGIGAEEIAAGDLDGDITWTFTGLSGPIGGVFSVWNSGTTSWTESPTPLITSASGFGLSNSLTIEAGGHAHFNYGFTAPGLYDVSFSATATLAAALGGGPVSGTGTFRFGVFDTGSPYPEPSPMLGPYVFFGNTFDNYLYGDGHVDRGIALAAVPEPSSIVLAGLGAAGLAGAALRRRMRKQSSAASRG